MKVLKERFDTLSDVIIAIIMTVLVLEIHIPETVNQLPQLAEAVGLFLVSFVILMNFWFHRLEISYLSDSGNLTCFILDVACHAFLSLYPLAVKMLIIFEVKWISILLFGMLNLITGLFINIMAIILTKQETARFTPEEKEFLVQWQQRRTLSMSIIDIAILMIALNFNQFGMYFYVFSPFIEFLLNYKQGSRIQDSLTKGQSLKKLIERKYRRIKI